MGLEGAASRAHTAVACRVVSNNFVTGQEQQCMKTLRLLHYERMVFVVLRFTPSLQCASGHGLSNQNPGSTHAAQGGMSLCCVVCSARPESTCA